MKKEGPDPRVVRTRGLIEGAFNELLEEKSFDDITVGDIAERASVNRATFYSHFTDKYTLLDHVMRDGFRRMLEEKVPENEGLTPENLERLILALCDFLSNRRGQCRRMHRQFEPLMEVQGKEVVRDLLLGWLEGKSGKGKRATTALEMAATVASWSIYGATNQWNKAERRPAAKTFARDLLPLVTASLAQVIEMEQTGVEE